MQCRHQDLHEKNPGPRLAEKLCLEDDNRSCTDENSRVHQKISTVISRYIQVSAEEMFRRTMGNPALLRNGMVTSVEMRWLKAESSWV